mmetsp:Transcript_37191/g.79337  ORF Transcript_37191/g.79337 Transcript_37191/m.79337 type:complete len:99 (+) Transcript_37191:150-446(+)
MPPILLLKLAQWVLVLLQGVREVRGGGVGQNEWQRHWVYTISSPFVSCSCSVSHDNLLVESFPTVVRALNPDPGVRDKPSSFPENALKFLKIAARSRA